MFLSYCVLIHCCGTVFTGHFLALDDISWKTIPWCHIFHHPVSCPGQSFVCCISVECATSCRVHSLLVLHVVTLINVPTLHTTSQGAWLEVAFSKLPTQISSDNVPRSSSVGCYPVLTVASGSELGAGISPFPPHESSHKLMVLRFAPELTQLVGGLHLKVSRNVIRP
jgi:hypothetical protein